MSDTPDPVERALSLLVEASRVSRPLRDAVATVETEVRRLRAERGVMWAAVHEHREHMRGAKTTPSPAERKLWEVLGDE